MVTMSKHAKKHQLASLVLLDRDGVLNVSQSPGGVTLKNLKLVPKMRRSMAKLSAGNFYIGIITNQPDIARKSIAREDVNQVNSAVAGEMRKAGIKKSMIKIEFCPHTKDMGCECRKPNIGMVEKIVKRFGLNPKFLKICLIGDMYTDIQTMENYYAQVLKPIKVPRSRVTTIFLTWKYGEKNTERRFLTVGNAKISPDFKLGSLWSAIDKIAKLNS